MKYGFVKTAAVSPKIRVADTEYNAQETIRLMREAWEKGARIIVFPELGITGYTCSDLFRQDILLNGAKKALQEIVAASKGMDGLFFAGLPLEINGKLYNVAAAYSDGYLLGLVPKTYIPNYSEFYEARHFTAAPVGCTSVTWQDGTIVPFGTDLLSFLKILLFHLCIFHKRRILCSSVLSKGFPDCPSRASRRRHSAYADLLSETRLLYLPSDHPPDRNA